MIESEGMPLRDGRKGDLVLKFNILFPMNVSPPAIDQFMNCFDYHPQVSSMNQGIILKDAEVEKYIQHNSSSSSHENVRFDDVVIDGLGEEYIFK